jgi:molybdopterin-guanine dinucleotide biosynthesis protein B
MVFPKAVAVVGFKKVGKTQVVEALVKELTSRGRRVGTLKHTARDYPLDSLGKDTWRHSAAGSVASAILTPKRAAFFINYPTDIADAILKLGSLDIVLIEGFKKLDFIPRIIVPGDNEEIKTLANGTEIAVACASCEAAPSTKVPTIPLNKIADLADIVEARSFPFLPGLNCGSCGYSSCRELVRAILSGNARAEECNVRQE